MAEAEALRIERNESRETDEEGGESRTATRNRLQENLQSVQKLSWRNTWRYRFKCN